MRIITKAEMLAKLDLPQVISLQEAGFVAYSQGQIVAPPVGHLHFVSPPGDCHIKYGMLKDDDIFIVKIAQSFYDNPKLGLPSSNGVMLVFSAKTGNQWRFWLMRGI